MYVTLPYTHIDLQQVGFVVVVFFSVLFFLPVSDKKVLVKNMIDLAS